MDFFNAKKKYFFSSNFLTKLNKSPELNKFEI